MGVDMPNIRNPFTPGAGHTPPYLAGRDSETAEFTKLLDQDVVRSNVVLTGLRGVGKTVLLDQWKPVAINQRWLWVGTDLSESASISEESLVIRLLTDLSVVTSGIVLSKPIPTVGFSGQPSLVEHPLTYDRLLELYRSTPGLVSDRLKQILGFVWQCIHQHGFRGIIFAYDEAQTMSDHVKKEQFPLALLLDVFQSLQRQKIPFMLVLVGLPTLFPKLVESRTFAERMFVVITLARLTDKDSKEAIVRPIKLSECPFSIDEPSIAVIVSVSGGYPYFIQFVCREVFDLFLQKYNVGEPVVPVPIEAITRKLDKDFFSGRWAKATDRQRQLLSVISTLENCDEEFTVQEIVEKAKALTNPFSGSHVNQMLVVLSDAGLIYKNRHGRYAFAVPLLGRFVRRQDAEAIQGPHPVSRF